MSDRSEYVEVYDIKSKINRTVTRAAYKIIGPRRYQLLNEDVPAPDTQSPQKKSVEVVAPVEDKPAEKPEPNENVTHETPQEGVTIVRRKPGPKPKQKPNG